jgi:hypothetical protein
VVHQLVQQDGTRAQVMLHIERFVDENPFTLEVESLDAAVACADSPQLRAAMGEYPATSLASDNPIRA